jgi:WD40 repeat protein
VSKENTLFALLFLLAQACGPSVEPTKTIAPITTSKPATTLATTTPSTTPSTQSAEPISLVGHSKFISSAEFSPDDTRILTASLDAVNLWEVSTGKLLLTLDDPNLLASSASFSPDGTRIVTGGFNNAIKVWNASTGKLLSSFEEPSKTITIVKFSPDGNRILSLDKAGKAKLWDFHGRVLLELLHLSAAEFSPDGTKLLVSSIDGSVTLYDAKTKKPSFTLLRRVKACPQSGAFNADSTRIVTIDCQAIIRLWDTKPADKKDPLLTFKNPPETSDRSMLRASFSPDGTSILTTNHDKTAKLWKAIDGALLFSLEEHTDSLWSASFSHDGSRILTVSDDKTAKVWEVSSGKLLATLGDKTNKTWDATFSSDGAHIVTVSAETAKIWKTP